MRKLIMAAIGVASVVFLKRQQQAKKDADLWREATNR